FTIAASWRNASFSASVRRTATRSVAAVPEAVVAGAAADWPNAGPPMARTRDASRFSLAISPPCAGAQIVEKDGLDSSFVRRHESEEKAKYDRRHQGHPRGPAAASPAAARRAAAAWRGPPPPAPPFGDRDGGRAPRRRVRARGAVRSPRPRIRRTHRP